MDQATVKKFLDRFKVKAKAFGIRFRTDRPKNFQALLDLEISSQKRENVVLSLNPEDYYNGPSENRLNNDGELWEFGKKVKKKDVYIKLAEGEKANQAVCVSFHPAEHKIEYPLKKNKEENHEESGK